MYINLIYIFFPIKDRSTVLTICGLITVVIGRFSATVRISVFIISIVIRTLLCLKVLINFQQYVVLGNLDKLRQFD